MSLSHIYEALHHQAARSGEPRGQTLTGGARITVRVLGGVTTLTISRRGKHVGDTELMVFRRDCGVPETAERRPSEGQSHMTHEGSVWFYLSFRWTETTGQEELPL